MKLMQRLENRRIRSRKKKNRERKNAAKRKYMEFRESLPVREDLVILEARNGRTIDGNIYYIARELLTAQAYAHLKIYIVYENEEARRSIQQKISGFNGPALTLVELQSEEYYRIMASAKYLVNDSAIRNFFIKREGQVYLNVWHGTPLKVMGRRVVHEPHATGSVQKNFVAADYLLYPSEYMMEHMLEDYMIRDAGRGTCLLGGYPRNTAFFDDESRSRIREELDLQRYRVCAYMPTWRPEQAGEELRDLLRQMDEGLLPDEILYVNIHPLAAEEIDFSSYRSVRPFPEGYEVYRFLNAADALITDYSSVFYDFAVTGRRIVLFTYDEEEYFRIRGVYEPLESLPFARTRTVQETLEALRAPGQPDRSAFLKRFCRFESPRAAEVLCRQVFLGEDCMEKREIPGNGLENVLVFGGDLMPGERTDALMRYLADPGKPPANYYLTFNRRDVNESKDILFQLPPGVRYFGRTGAVTLTDRQQQIRSRYEEGKVSFREYWEAVRPAFALEKERYYADMPIRRVVQIPEGREPGPDVFEEELEFSTY